MRRIKVDYKESDVQFGYKNGDIAFWPPASNFVIFVNGEIFEQQPIGHTDDDLSFFNGMGTTEIKFERE